MKYSDRAEMWLSVVLKLQEAWNQIDSLTIGDVTGNPSRLKHLLDNPIKECRNYAREWYLKDDTEK